MELMNEEVVLLLTQGLAKLVEFKELSYPAEPENKRKREEIHSSSFIEQAKLFKEERTTQLLKIADKIIEGKRKKAKGSFDEAVAIQEEIAKIPEMTEESMMVQIFTSNLHFFNGYFSTYYIFCLIYTTTDNCSFF